MIWWLIATIFKKFAGKVKLVILKKRKIAAGRPPPPKRGPREGEGPGSGGRQGGGGNEEEGWEGGAIGGGWGGGREVGTAATAVEVIGRRFGGAIRTICKRGEKRVGEDKRGELKTLIK